MPELPSNAKKTRPTRRAFTEQEVIETALGLVDRGFGHPVSIRAVATALDVNPNAIYTYVTSRADLERAVAEHVLGDADQSAFNDESPWNDSIVKFCTGLRTTLLNHPGVAMLLMRAPMDGPAAREIGENLMRILIAAGLDVETASRTTYAVIVHTLGSIALEVAETDGTPPLPPEEDRIAGRREALSAIDESDYPLTARSAGTMADWISGGQFEWGLRAILAGAGA
ncbi:TetR/AcrR family transcriptional regulator [Smaragdicoccus niigatensis]|uniref:TetR/AcrR family transcriptional regulator n=1 Tax=Smaragdicoccus niigatensis TaxID=359359 RepID=UPI00037D8F10|nr:TetR/AcrR family transcriptional regulator C-terminal domain-containing protein [Smaragdicoccus niigatensis]